MSTIQLAVLEPLTPKKRIQADENVVTWESLHPDLQKMLLEADNDIAEGRIHSSEEVFRELDEWLEKD